MTKEQIITLIGTRINSLAIKSISLTNKLHAYPPNSPGYHKTNIALRAAQDKQAELQELLDLIYDEELKEDTDVS